MGVIKLQYTDTLGRRCSWQIYHPAISSAKDRVSVYSPRETFPAEILGPLSVKVQDYMQLKTGSAYDVDFPQLN